MLSKFHTRYTRCLLEKLTFLLRCRSSRGAATLIASVGASTLIASVGASTLIASGGSGRGAATLIARAV